MLGFTGFEYVKGGNANDTFNIMAANQQIKEYQGGAGDDTFKLFGLVTVPGLINGDGGTDRLDYSAYGRGVLVNLASHLAQAIFGGADGGIFGIESVIGSNFADTLIGDENDNTLEGLDGDDIIIGGPGDDLLKGGLGSDIYRFLAEWGQDIIEDLGGIADEIDFSDIQVAMSFTFMFGGIGVTGGGQRLTIRGNNIELIKSGSGDDEFILGEDGVKIADGNGIIDGGGGINTLDYSTYSEANPVTVDLELGIATGTTSIANFSNVYGGAGHDTLMGNEQDNILRGGTGDDLLDGRGGNDTLDESNSNVNLSIDLSRSDAQNTGIGNDTIINMENLRTGSGDDILQGLGNGNSCILEGGLGNDRYVFAGNWNGYTIIDIGGDQDVFDFSALNSDLNFVFDNIVSITDGSSSYSHSSGGIEKFLGGSGNDIFNIREGMAAGIAIDGQDGQMY